MVVQLDFKWSESQKSRLQRLLLIKPITDDGIATIHLELPSKTAT